MSGQNGIHVFLFKGNGPPELLTGLQTFVVSPCCKKAFLTIPEVKFFLQITENWLKSEYLKTNIKNFRLNSFNG